MALNPNQFTQIPVQGQIDLTNGSGGNVITGAVSVNAGSGALVPFIAGQPVKIDQAVGLVGGVPKLLPLAANTDIAFGFVVFNIKDISHPIGSNFEMAKSGSVMYMTTGGAILAGAGVEVVYTANTVITTGGTNPVVGTALDHATASGQLIRVILA